jgi:hypothetical protein
VDRRRQSRFEVVGDLWGTLDILQPLPVVNIGSGGALVQSDRPWPIGSVHSVVVANGSETGDVRICVRHVTPHDDGAHRVYFIGVEFLNISPALAEEVSRWMADNSAKAGG